MTDSRLVLTTEIGTPLEPRNVLRSSITADVYNDVAPTQGRQAADRLQEAIEW